MSDSVTFVSENRILKGQQITLSVGDSVKFHQAGSPCFYVGRVLSFAPERVLIQVTRDITGAGNAGLHRKRKGHVVRVLLSDVYELLRNAAVTTAS